MHLVHLGFCVQWYYTLYEDFIFILHKTNTKIYLQIHIYDKIYEAKCTLLSICNHCGMKCTQICSIYHKCVGSTFFEYDKTESWLNCFFLSAYSELHITFDGERVGTDVVFCRRKAAKESFPGNTSVIGG